MKRVLRFNFSERLYHWVQAFPYTVLVVTGGWMLYGRATGRPIDAATLTLVHRVSGVALPLGMLLVFIGGDTRSLWRNFVSSLHFGRRDLLWLVLMPVHVVVPKVKLPPAGKFNAGQKINLLSHMLLIPLFVVSGFLMWFLKGALIAWVLHVACFALAVPLLIGHLFLALVNRSTRKGLSGMVTGRVDAEWAHHHHPLAYANERDP